MLRLMRRHLFPSLRRSRALFALALCAWLLLAGMAWAAGGCCDAMQAAPAKAMAMDGHAGMDGMHDAQPQVPHSHGAWAPDCTCAHAPANLAGVAMVAAAHPSPERLSLPRGHEATPQPLAKPPLRPPSV